MSKVDDPRPPPTATELVDNGVTFGPGSLPLETSFPRTNPRVSLAPLGFLLATCAYLRSFSEPPVPRFLAVQPLRGTVPSDVVY